MVQSRARIVKCLQLWGCSGVRDGAQGWNADQFGQALVLLLVRPFGVWNVVGVGGLVVGTLLGPEGVGRLCWFLGSPGSWGSGCLLCGRPACRRTARMCSGAGGGGWWVIFRTLRTAQWTRASCKYCSGYPRWSAYIAHRTWLSAGVRGCCGGRAWVLCVVKLLRAHGGCLGTRSR